MADFIGLSTYRELDPAKKNVAWADDCITQFRRDWRRMWNIQDARKNREYLLSSFDMARTKKLFKDKRFKEMTDFVPIATFEKIKNILVSELTKNPPKARIKAKDPTAIQMKERDIQILKNRKYIETDLTDQHQRVGLPKYKLPYDVFQSNINKFDEMGLSADDADDLGIYSEVWHKLLYEIEGTNLINSILATNKFDEFIKQFVIDILAVKAVCYQAYVSRITGEIKYRHLFPETCFGLFGSRADSADAICLGWQDTVTIRDFLDYVGNDFDWNRDWKQLLWALNFCNGQKYTGFRRNNIEYHDHNLSGHNEQPAASYANGANYEGEGRVNLMEWTDAYNYKVYMGYIEWKSIDADSYKTNADTGQTFTVPYNYKITDRSKYQKESYYMEMTYCSSFLATSTTDQFLYGYGKLYHQLTEGQNDEYSSYSLSFYREEGLPAIEIAKPYINLANDAFYKMVWAVAHAKPDSDVYWINELVQVSKAFDKIGANNGQNPAGTNMQGILQNVIDFERENMIKIRDYPRPDGKLVVQPPPTNDIKRNGLDPVAIAMQTVVTWAEQNIMAKVGINELREGSSPDPKDGYKINAAAVMSSRNATGYIDRMIQYMMQHTVTVTTLLVQDIIQLKDSKPYNYILRIAGTNAVKSIEQLENFAAHRLGIYVISYNSEIERQKVEALTMRAQENKEITAEQAFIVSTIEDYEKAGYVLTYLKKKEEKRQQKIVQQQQQFQKQMQQEAHDQQMELLTTKIKGELAVKQIDLRRTQIEAEAMYRSKMDVKQLTVNSEGPKQADKADAQKELETHKANLKQQAPYGLQPAGQ